MRNYVDTSGGCESQLGSQASDRQRTIVCRCWNYLQRAARGGHLALFAWTLSLRRVKPSSHPTQRTQRTQRNERNACDAWIDTASSRTFRLLLAAVCVLLRKLFFLLRLRQCVKKVRNARALRCVRCVGWKLGFILWGVQQRQQFFAPPPPTVTTGPPGNAAAPEMPGLCDDPTAGCAW